MRQLLARWRDRPWLLRWAVLLVAALAAWLPVVWAPQSVHRLEEGLGDTWWRLGASTQAERRVVLVDIDERSLRELGPWPWPRHQLAELNQRLAQAGVRVQALDIAFSDVRPGDAVLQSAWAETSPVVAQVFSLDPTVTPMVGQVTGPLAAPGCPPFAPRSYGAYGTAASLLGAQPTVGHITPRIALDGVVREVPALVCHEGRAYPNLALATLWRAAQPASASAATAPDWQWHLAQTEGSSSLPSFPPGLGPSAWLTSRSLPGLVVPVDAQGNVRVPYGVARQAMASVSAVDVLRGQADRSLLQGAIVIVGATAFGIGDTIATPLSTVASGLEVHAQELVGLLDQRLPYTPHRWSHWQGLLTIALAAVLLWLSVGRTAVPAKRLPLIGAGLAVLMLAGSAAALWGMSLWLPWWPLVAFALLASAGLATVEHALVRAQRERLSAHLGAYLPTPVAQRLMRSDPSGQLQIEQRKVSVLVADIRNFSALATHCEPQEVGTLLHQFCCVAVDVVERHGGVVENVVGDAVVAVWTAEGDGPEHARRALAAAQELLRATRPLLTSSRPVTELSPVQPLALGVGLESGRAIVGSFGPARRRAYAALGEPVSVAGRIQGMTADLSVPILLGPQMAAALGAAGVHPMGEFLLEGMGRAYAVFAPAGWDELSAVDSNWAHSAVGGADKTAEEAEWSRWRDTSSGASAPTARLLSALRRGSA